MNTTKGGKGTRLGLATVNQIVLLASGFIDVQSAIGQETVCITWRGSRDRSA